MSKSRKIQRIYPLSPMQEGMLFDSLLQTESGVYFEQVTLSLVGEVDEALLERSFQALIDRHDIFRTAFVHERVDRPKQVVLAQADVRGHFEDIAGLAEPDQQRHLDAFRRRDREAGFDLTAAPLLRVALFRTRRDRCELVLSFHHILMDGWCVGLVLDDVLQSYRAGHNGTPLPDRQSVPYERYIQWLGGLNRDESLRYWSTYLEGCEHRTTAPGAGESRRSEGYELREHRFTIDRTTTDRLQRLATDCRVTLSTVFQGLWSILLHRYNDTGDVLFGAVVSGRPAEIEGIEDMIGLCINTVPVRVALRGEMTFAEFVQSIQSRALGSRPHEHVALADIQARTPLKSGLFDHIVVFENYPRGGPTERAGQDLGTGFRIEKFEAREQTGYDLNIIVGLDDGLVVRLNCNHLVYDSETLLRVADQLVFLAQQVTETPGVRVDDLGILSPAEREQILHEFNSPPSDYPAHKTLPQLFEEQVGRTPANMAVVCGDTALTYRQLNEHANQIASCVRERYRTEPDDVVAILADRNQHMMAGILGILKAGAGYLPIEPSWPAERIQNLLNGAQVKALLCQKAFLEKAGQACETLCLDDGSIRGSRTDLPGVNRPTDLAYVMFTSGSTGEPKGVMVEHRSVVRLVRNTNYLQFGEEDRILPTCAPMFDVSTFEQWGALLNGGCLYLFSDDVILDVEELGRQLSENAITTLWLTSPLFNHLAEQDDGIFAHLKYLLVGGDVLSPPHIRRVRQRHPRLTVINGYGPTENTTFSTCHIITRDHDRSIPIGKPISNSTAYILDRHGDLAPVGAVGELYVGGDGVARGYLNRPELTAELFVPDPFRGKGQLYRTGDLARWLPDGTIEFLGRRDEQVKIRGNRVELAEIEHHLAKYPGVGNVAVIARALRNQGKEVMAYVVPAPNGSIDARQLRAQLQQTLPDYMIPSYITFLDALPLKPSGKLDRNALPDPDATPEGTHAPPKNDAEKLLAQVWQDVLCLHQVGIDDSFFDLGGDSIKALQIASRLRKHDRTLKIRDLFRHPTIRDLAPRVQQRGTASAEGIAAGEMELTPIQRWFFERFDTGRHHFNQAALLRVPGGVDVDALVAAFTALVEHHDALRMAYATDDGQTVQRYRGAETKLFDLSVVDLRRSNGRMGDPGAVAEAITKQGTRIQGSIDLATGPLVKLGLFRTDDGDCLLIAIHHLVVDGFSWRILIEDLHAAYRQAAAGEPIELPEKTQSFQRWAGALGEHAESAELQAERSYWENVAGAAADLLPKDRTVGRSERTMASRETVDLVFDETETERLLRRSNRPYGTTTEDLLLAGLSIVLCEEMGLRRILLNLEGHGREQFRTDLDVGRTVGWFTSLFPARIDVARPDDLAYQIRSVKETIRRIPNRGIGHGILRYLTPSENRPDRRMQVEPEICFNYLGEFDVQVTDGLFELSAIDPGESASTELPILHALDVSARVDAGRLTATIAYSSSEYDRGTIERLAQSYRIAIGRITEHCCAASGCVLTPSDVGDPALTLEEFDALPFAATELEAIYPLSPLQEGMFFHALRDEQSRAYFEQTTLSLRGDVDVVLLERAFNSLIARHQPLRSVFVHTGVRSPRQIVLKRSELVIATEDVSHLAPDEKQARITAFARHDRERGFDLARGPLLRVALLKTEPHACQVVWSFHHILMDGWSVGRVFGDLLRLYGMLRAGRDVPVESSPDYGDYVAWARRQGTEAGLNYWRGYLDGYEDRATVPVSARVPTRGLYDFAEHEFSLDKATTRKLTEIARASQVTLSTVFRALWGVLLQRYNNTRDVVFGAVVSGRPPAVEGIEEMIGLFINTIPVRVRVGDAQSFVELLQDVQEASLASRDHEQLPLTKIQKCTALGSDLIDHILIFENYPIDDAIRQAGSADHLGFRAEDAYTREQTNYDFNLVVVPGEQFHLKFTYNALAHDRDAIETIASHLLEIAGRVAADPDAPVRDIRLLTGAERQRLLVDFNDTAVDYPSDRTIVDLFEEQVARTPDRTALAATDRQWTYSELNAEANRVACQLRETCDPQPDDLIGIVADTGAWGVIAILAVLKAGAAYVPIDPAGPDDRIRFLIEDSRCKRLLHRGPIRESLRTACDVPVLDITRAGTGPGADNPPRDAGGHNLAYVIYTSGSTGQPKGVMVEHGSLVNYLSWVARTYGRGQPLSFPLFTSLSFDLTVTSLFAPLITGGTVVVYGDLEAKEALDRIFSEGKVGVVKLTPAHLRLLRGSDRRGCAVRRLIVGGENLDTRLCRDITEDFHGNVEIYNEYGPTEATVGCMIHRFDPDHDVGESVPIGVPADNAGIWLLDRDGNPAPIGGIGEICISGTGLARGYLHRAELTGDRFVSHPLVPGNRIYRTGDLGRWLPDAKIEFLGRLDDQVKIRGHRVELGEVEHYVRRHPGIAQTVVLARKLERDYAELIAYAVPPEGAEAPNTQELRGHLARLLPDHMIPSYCVALDEIPLTPHGKVNRRALPDPVVAVGLSAAPGNEVERTLQAVWGEALGVDGLGIDNNFFEIGGDSIKAIEISAGLQARGLAVKIGDIFSHPTIRSLAGQVVQASHLVSQEAVEGLVELTPIQRWFFARPAIERHHYNQAVMLHRPEGLDEGLLRKALARLVEHHDALRMVFQPLAEGVQQRNRGPAEVGFDLVAYDLREAADVGAEIAEAVESIQRSMDLAHGPLLKVGLFDTADGAHLLIAIHHLVVDGVSWRVLLDDLARLYEQASAGAELSLPAKTASYQAWAAMLGEYAQSAELLSELSYWREIEASMSGLPLPGPDVSSGNGDGVVGASRSVSVSLSKEETSRLLRETHRAYGTEVQDLLLTALGLAAAERFGVSCMPVLLEGHGREELAGGMDTSRTAGWFTSQFPVLLDMGEQHDLAYRITSVKEMLRGVPHRGVGYGILRYVTPVELLGNEVLSADPEFAFNYLGQVDQAYGDDGGLRMSRYPVGDCVSPNMSLPQAIGINALISGEVLSVHFTCKQNWFGSDTVEVLAGQYRRNLVEIISHCVQATAGVALSSHRKGPDISVRDLDKIKAFIKQI